MARRGIFVPLLDEHREALFDLADREWRRPVDQAAKILIEGLQAAGALEHANEGHVASDARAVDRAAFEPLIPQHIRDEILAGIKDKNEVLGLIRRKPSRG